MDSCTRTEFGCAVIQNRAEVTLWPSFSTVSYHDGVTSNNGILVRYHTEGSGVEILGSMYLVSIMLSIGGTSMLWQSSLIKHEPGSNLR